MKNNAFLFLTVIFLTVSVNSQDLRKSGPGKNSLPNPRPTNGSSRTTLTKPKVDFGKPNKPTNNKRDTTKARESARLGVKRHQEIQSRIVPNKKGRQAEVRFSDSKTRKGMRADILTKSNRMFEIKPDTKSGRSSRSKNQLRKYEDASQKRGGMIHYEPQTGKYKIERTPYKEWTKRKQLLPTKEKTRQQRPQSLNKFHKPRPRF